jgi:hypothetical protein
VKVSQMPVKLVPLQSTAPAAHDLAPGFEVVPEGQGVQEVLPGEEEKVPAGHGAAPALPDEATKLPAGACMQDRLPTDLAKLPAGHGVQRLLPVPENDPVGQGWQLPPPLSKDPAPQPWVAMQFPCLQV